MTNSLQATPLLPAAEEVSSQEPLCRLSKRVWRDKPLLGLGVWYRARHGTTQNRQVELVCVRSIVCAAQCLEGGRWTRVLNTIALLVIIIRRTALARCPRLPCLPGLCWHVMCAV